MNMNFKNLPYDMALTVSVLCLAAAVPLFHPSGYVLTMLCLIGIYAIALKGLDFVTGYTGELSVGHAALFGLGAYTAGWLNVHAGLNFVLAIPASIAVSAFAAWLISFPLLRVSGPFLVLTTFAFGRIVYIFLSQTTAVTGGQSGLQLDPQSLGGHAFDATDYYLCILGALALTTALVHKIVHSKLGRAFEALRDSPIATDCIGIGAAVHKQKAFVLSGAFGGLAGVLYVFSQGIIFPDSFGFEMSLMLLMAALFGGKKSSSGPLLGAAFVVVFPDILGNHSAFRVVAVTTLALLALNAALRLRRGARGWSELGALALPLAFAGALVSMAFLLDDLNEYRLAIYGGIILMVVSYLGNGILGLLPGFIPGHKTAPADAGSGITRVAADAGRAALLDVQAVSMRFGGFTALSEVSLTVAPGMVLGLIGPNGAGKSTMQNLLTALYRPSAGKIVFDGHDLAHIGTTAIAKLGIARTFQNLQTFGDLSVLDNVLAGMHNTMTARAPGRAMALLRTVGLEPQAHMLAKDLSYGQQRYLEIARALATNPKLLLLDEPAAGLRGDDLKALKLIIATVKQHGIAVILIEHHIDVIMELSDQVAVLNFGQLIACGAPQQIQNDPAVQDAYLGV
jgi:ABC-type branched-subunit amino acid transport system ATPase component/ABC-type branched-subunit amino acid transport system permease subunit